MTVGRGAAWRRGRALLAALLIVAVSGCGNRDNIFHGALFNGEGDAIIAAALMPACACMTLQSNVDAPILVVSRFFGEEIGKLTMPPRGMIRVRFDWAGGNNDDVYDIGAYELTPQGERGNAIVPLQPSLEIVGQVVSSSCADEVSCTFTTLSMNRAWSGRVGQELVEAHARGVEFRRGGQTLDVAASLGACGCMMLRNTSTAPLMLLGRHRTGDTGHQLLEAGRDIRVAFDAAGLLHDDVYVLTARAVDTMADIPINGNGTAGATVPAEVTPGQAAAVSLRIQDHVAIVGQMDQMICDRTGEVVPGGGAYSTVDGETTTCPFGALGLNRMSDTQMAMGAAAAAAQPAPAAPAGGGGSQMPRRRP